MSHIPAAPASHKKKKSLPEGRLPATACKKAGRALHNSASIRYSAIKAPKYQYWDC